MPQSISYKRWLEQALDNEEFSAFEVIYRSVPYIKSEGGHIRMTRLAQQHVKELNSQVDLFLSPNDQMGAQPPYAQMIFSSATKPLVGLGRKDVVDSWGATVSVYPSLPHMGQCVAQMILQWRREGAISGIPPRWPKVGVVLDAIKMAQFQLTAPTLSVLKAAVTSTSEASCDGAAAASLSLF